MLTDNNVIVRNIENLPALMCVQRKADKKIPTESDFITSNISSFGDEIGMTTNWITSMYEVQSHFKPGDREWEVLDYRIRCGQLYQQNSIDKAKGIVCNPMPREWHDKHAARRIEDEDTRDLYVRICADKKPYFMKYIYTSLAKEYNAYVKNTNKDCLRKFGLSVDELIEMPENDRTEQQTLFVERYNTYMPVGIGDCVMNRICERIEREFDGYIGKKNKSSAFDYSIMRSDSKYTNRQYEIIAGIFGEYVEMMKIVSAEVSANNMSEYDSWETIDAVSRYFNEQCAKVCPDKSVLCNILLDICYTKSVSKQYVWNLCEDEIITNLLFRNDHMITYPTKDPFGDIEFGGERFSMVSSRVEVV